MPALCSASNQEAEAKRCSKRASDVLVTAATLPFLFLLSHHRQLPQAGLAGSRLRIAEDALLDDSEILPPINIRRRSFDESVFPAMNSLMDNVQRRRQNLNPLTTQLNQGHHQPYQPASAVGLSSPFHNQTPYTPLSAATQYNPQQWSAGPVGYPPDHSGRYSPAAMDVVDRELPRKAVVQCGG